MRILIVVTHLLGTGHLARALTLGRAFAAAGDNVTVVSGGLPVPHFDTAGLALVQLPPVRSNGVDFTTLLTDDGTVAGPDHFERRRDTLMGTLERVAPDVMITELFPFGRRILRAEFAALLQAARERVARPVILSSIRDILAPPSKPAKAAFADDMVAAFYDAVLVHADPELITLDRSWPVSDMLTQRLHYTGFVAPAPPAVAPQTGEVLVSAGGGSVGNRVFAAACDAAVITPGTQWRCLVGGDEARRAAVRHKAPANLTVEAPRPDFRALLAGAAASVSMCGYNTAMDVLQTGVGAVLIPFDDGGEVEQGLRAQALRDLDGIAVLHQDTLTGAVLAKAVADVQTAPKRAPRHTGMDGAASTVDIVHALRARHPL